MAIIRFIIAVSPLASVDERLWLARDVVNDARIAPTRDVVDDDARCTREKKCA